jgi:hypothetical protein
VESGGGAGAGPTAGAQVSAATGLGRRTLRQ